MAGREILILAIRVQILVPQPIEESSNGRMRLSDSRHIGSSPVSSSTSKLDKNMKIISNFKDYYDSVGAYDQDPEPVYIRHSKDIEYKLASSVDNQDAINLTEHLNGLFFPKQVMIKEKYEFFPQSLSLPETYPLNFSTENYRNPRQTDIGYISFCGKVYPFYILNGSDSELYCYNIEQYIAAIKLINPVNKNKILDSIESGEYEIKLPNSKKFKRKDFISRFTWQKFISNYNNKIDIEHYRYFNCPVALRRYKWHGDPPAHKQLIILNPRLNQYNFQSQVEPYTAYQELSMYLGNDLVDISDMEPRPITDKDRAETKGFNEWSFRRHKTEDKKYKKQHGE